MKKSVFGVFVNDDDEILCLKRNESKKSYPNQWDAISGKIEENETAEECLMREISEEICISNFEIIRKEESFVYEEEGEKWLMHPFLCKIKEGSIILNKEHKEYKWMKIKELLELDYALPFKIGLQKFFDI